MYSLHRRCDLIKGEWEGEVIAGGEINGEAAFFSFLYCPGDDLVAFYFLHNKTYQGQKG